MKGKDKWKGYLNYSLTTSQKKSLVADLQSLDTLLDFLDKQAEFGTRISYALKGKEESPCLTFTFGAYFPLLNGYSISSWGKDLFQCLSVMYFIWSSGIYGENLEGLAPIEDEDWFSP